MAILAGVAGIAISGYLTAVHYAGVPLACPANGAVNCDVVLSSPYAIIGGSTVPTSAAGIVWFAVSAVLWTAATSDRVSRLRLAWSVIGAATVIGLLFVEIVLLGTICLWCTGAHLLVIVTLIAAVADRTGE